MIRNRSLFLAVMLFFVVSVRSARADSSLWGGIVGVPNAGIDPPPTGPTDPGPIIDGGCTNSPESPTAVLGLLGFAGIGLSVRVRRGFADRQGNLRQ